MRKHTINFLSKLSVILAYLAEQLRNMQVEEHGYYVYIPQKEKPKRVHENYKLALKESTRLYNEFKKRGEHVNVQILQIIRNDRVEFCPY